MRNHPCLLALLGGLAATACTSDPSAAQSLCVAHASAVDCTIDGASAESLSLVAYSCPGTARPDEDPTYIDGVPQGLVCASHASVGNDGTSGFCCSAQVTTCAYNPIAICDPNTYGYQCRGANRPEALNPAIYCNQGVREGDLISYCCSGATRTPACTQSDAVGCSPRLMGWTCPVGNLPAAQDLGANKSRADVYYQVCAVPKPAANPKYNSLCCYTPGQPPPGSSCEQNTAVAGCDPGRFGFSCYGPDTPEDDFGARISCPNPGQAGVSAEGYPATLYCCDFQ